MRKKVPTDHVLIVHEESNTVSFVPVLEESADMLHTKHGTLPKEGSVTRYNESSGHLIHFYHLDIPAKVEARNIADLRRSVVIRNMFRFDKTSSFDLMKYMPWIVVIALIIFK